MAVARLDRHQLQIQRVLSARGKAPLDVVQRLPHLRRNSNQPKRGPHRRSLCFEPYRHHRRSKQQQRNVHQAQQVPRRPGLRTGRLRGRSRSTR